MMILTERFWTFYATVYDTLLQLHPYRGMIGRLVDSLEKPGLDVLDAGCGSGNVTRLLLDRGHRVIGLDSSPGMLSRARTKCPQAELVEASLDTRLPYADGTFDAVTCSNVLYSLPRPRLTLSELRRVLRPGGRLLLTNPTPDFSMKGILREDWRTRVTLGQGWLSLIGIVPRLFLLAAFNLVLLSRQSKRNFFFPEPDALRACLEEAGFEGVEIEPTYARQGWMVTSKGAMPEGQGIGTKSKAATAAATP